MNIKRNIPDYYLNSARYSERHLNSLQRNEL